MAVPLNTSPFRQAPIDPAQFGPTSPLGAQFAQPRAIDPVQTSQIPLNQRNPIGAPPTGLIGAEQALQAGGTGAIGANLLGGQFAREDITQGGQAATQALQQGQNILGQGFGQAGQTVGTAADVSQGLVGQGVERGIGVLGQQRGLSTLNSFFDQATDPITGFIDPGARAQILQGSLTGALGPEAQREAIANFSLDPGTQFQLEEAEKGLTRNAAAIGGLGGGRIRQQLSRNALGIAQGQLNTRIGQLGQQAALGLQAAQSAGQLRGTQGQIGANLLQQSDRDIANLIQTGALTQADIERSAGNTIAQLESTGALAGAGFEEVKAQVEQTTGRDLAQIAQNTGLNVSRIIENLGSTSAGLRTQAGRDLASAIASSSAQLADLQTTQGTGISGIVGTQVQNIGNLLLNQGLSDAAALEQQGVILANLESGQGSVAANVAANIGLINASSILRQSESTQQAITELGKAFGNTAFLESLTETEQAPRSTAELAQLPVFQGA